MFSLAAIEYRRGFDIDRLLIDACRMLTGGGLHIGGVVQISTGGRGGACATTTHVVDLRTGALFDVWDDRGPCAKGCRLDEDGLARAEPLLDAAIVEPVDILVVNRFGRAESLGRGLRGVFERALEAGVPLLTCVREPYVAAWRAFHGGLGTELGCEVAAAVRWAGRDRRAFRPQDRLPFNA